MWFEELTGFAEETPEQVRENLSVDGGVLKSLVNGKEYSCGTLEIPTLGELREKVRNLPAQKKAITVREVVSDVQQLHIAAENAGVLFQVASQFNLLEMVSPEVTPEDGVGCYGYDHTQGPACAIAAGAGTIYRNYFANVNGQVGQSSDHQIDCLADIGSFWDNSDHQLWRMTNGYALSTGKGLKAVNNKLNAATDAEIDEIKCRLRIGVQWGTQVTLKGSSHLVSQAYCSALPVAYSQLPAELWAEFSKLVLEASYEATLCAGIQNYHKTGNNTVYLTLIGGGAFGNDMDWILSAVTHALKAYCCSGLDIVFVSHGYSNRRVRDLVERFESGAGVA